MPRMRRCSYSSTIFLCFLILALWTFGVYSSDCWYDGRNHDEGSEVPTVEPCLNCTCSRGALLCYLRVCPGLPNPPPPGCILHHRHRACCPELVCPDFFFGGASNGLEARSDAEDLFEIPDDKKIIEDACVVNGSIYGPGSAMYSSSLCEYCYCLGGKQTCVKPKCLLPVDGCVPIYEPTNCCPVYYRCLNKVITSTTTAIPIRDEGKSKGGCAVDGMYYNEGDRVLGVGRSICDNCYCLRGVLRCEPLSCAPPLLGCSPIVRTGECCAASYNCSGTIQIRPEPNYGQFPVVSKEYAKLRKEVQNVPTKPSLTEKPNGPIYVIADSSSSSTKVLRSPATSGTTRYFTDFPHHSSTVKPQYYLKLKGSNKKSTTRSFDLYPAATTDRPSPITEKENDRSSDYLGLNDETLLSIVDSLLDNRLNRRIESSTDVPASAENSTIDDSASVITEDTESTTLTETTTEESSSDVTTDSPTPVTVKTVLNSTDCVDENGNVIERIDEVIEVTTVLPVDANEINNLEEVEHFDDSVTSISSEEPSVESTTFYDIESRAKLTTITKMPSTDVPFELETIINMTKEKESDYEFDYNEPSLPPSLPNLKIIPFVAADALDTDKEKSIEITYETQGQVTDSYGYANLFSPPVETEGGFIPKEPPILPNFYENAVTAQSATREINCVTKEIRNIPHGSKAPPTSPCVECVCHYGEITCQKVTCPNVGPGCTKSPKQDVASCCPQYICDDDHEAPTVVLDGLEGAVTVANGVITTEDPFKHVIRTEPAPNLHSLIVDGMPQLTRKTSAEEMIATTPKEKVEATKNDSYESGFSLDKVLQFFFSDEIEKDNKTEAPARIEMTTTVAPSVVGSKDSTSKLPNPAITESTLEDRQSTNHLDMSEDDGSSSSIGLLKLAGCNIYGRMYRVGRIISELSNPCLECKCTEVGVYCRTLKC